MKIFSLLFLLLLLGPGTAYAASDPMQFLAPHAAPEDMLCAISSGQTINSCRKAQAWLICLEGRSWPGISANPPNRQAVLKGLEIKIRNAIANFLAEEIRAKNLQGTPTVGQTLAKEQNQGSASLKGLESLSFCEGNWCGAIAALRFADAIKNLPPLYESPAFIEDYSQARLEKIERLLQKGQGAEALSALKELRSLNNMNHGIDILAARAFLLEKNETDALKIAVALYKSARPMNADQLEDLGDLFLNLGREKEALELFNRASALLTGNNNL